MPRLVPIATALALFACVVGGGAAVAASQGPNPVVGLWSDGSRTIAVAEFDAQLRLVIPWFTPLGNCWGGQAGGLHELGFFNGRTLSPGQTLTGSITHWWPDFCQTGDRATLSQTSEDQLIACNETPPVDCMTLNRIPRLAPLPRQIPSPYAAARIPPLEHALLRGAERFDETGAPNATKGRRLRELAARLAAAAGRIPARDADDARYRACMLAAFRATARRVFPSYLIAHDRAEASTGRCTYVGIGLFASGDRAESPIDPTITSEATAGGRMTDCYTGDTLTIAPRGPGARVTVTTPGHYADIVDKRAFGYSFPYAPNGRWEVDLSIPSLGVHRHAVLDRACPS